MAKIITSEIEQLCLDEAAPYVEMMESARKAKKSNQRFAPVESALITLASLPENTWTDGQTFLDAECGIGQLLVPVAIIKRELGHSDILSTIYGTEIIEGNVLLCRQRLLGLFGPPKENIKYVEKNIVCCNSLKYDFEFK